MGKIIQHLGEVDADIVCLQEVDEAAFVSIDKALQNRGYVGTLQTGTLHATVKEKTTLPLYIQTTERKKNKKDIPGVATFYKQSMFTKTWTVESFRANILGLTLKKGHQKGRLLALMNCHLEGAPWKNKERRDQLTAAIKKLKKKPYSYSILCGDFNGSFEDNSLALNSAVKLGYTSAYHNHPSRDITCIITPQQITDRDAKVYMVDNLLHDKNVKTRAVMNVIDSSWDRKQILGNGLPSLDWPR